YNLFTDNSTISGNHLSGDRFEGIVLDQGNNASVTGNSVSGGNIGVLAIAFGGATADSVGVLSCNRITGATAAGIELLDADNSDPFIPRLTANSNAIQGNAVGADNTTPMSFNFTGNYWGCPNGPGNPGCDTVTGPLSVTPVAHTIPACIQCTTNAECNDGLLCTGSATGAA